MKMRLKRLREQTIVITGASSGIGLVTARMAVRQGARMVLAARSQDSLKKLEKEFNVNSGKRRAVAVEADVTSERDLEKVADTAQSVFGGFDTWVNNAGVSIFGEIMDIPVEDERQLFEINYWGTVYGSRIAVEHLRRRGGALINLGSVVSDRAVPLQGAYSASKHAVKAYTDTLRMELEHAGYPISVTLIKPTAIDTPFFQHAKTYMDAQPTEPSPMYAPEAVAEAILKAAEKPMRDVMVGGTAPIQSALGRWAPRLGDRYMKATMFEGQMSDRRPDRHDNRALDEPSGELRERGGYEAHTFETSEYTRASMNPMLMGAMAIGAGVALTTLLRARSSSGHEHDEDSGVDRAWREQQTANGGRPEYGGGGDL
jgi:short-subunit dehydrogenase